MSTIDQIEAFATFAKNQLGNGQECSIDDLYHQWRQQAFQDTDTLAVQASISRIGKRVKTILKSQPMPQLRRNHVQWRRDPFRQRQTRRMFNETLLQFVPRVAVCVAARGGNVSSNGRKSLQVWQLISRQQ